MAEWFKMNKLPLNIKNKLCIFSYQKHNTNTSLNILIYGIQVLEIAQTKFLGVIINNKLTWNDHIEMIKSKIAKNIAIICHMRFLVPRAVLMYRALVEPYLQYCNLVWATHRSSVLSELYLCQKRLLRIIANQDRRCRSIPQLFRQLNILPTFNINDLHRVFYAQGCVQINSD